MNIDLNHLEKYREGNRLEAKEAQGGIPGSIWETYSSFANTNGGIILLGVTELPDKALKAIGLSDPDMLVKQFWDGFNNPQKVSINILSDKDVSILEIDGVRIIQINVPRADRHDRPVYFGPEPFKGSYRRNGEGDYHCRADEVRNMYRDQSDISMDTRTVSELGMDAFDMESVSGYRRRLELSKPNHVWLKLSDEHFLIKLGAADYGDDKKLHPTGAGILMFGEEYRIVREFTGYFLDYREVEPGQERWVNRFVSSSGDWSGNLFDFYFRAINRIAQI
jgi:predicted HTH transcriptional regulator